MQAARLPIDVIFLIYAICILCAVVPSFLMIFKTRDGNSEIASSKAEARSVWGRVGWFAHLVHDACRYVAFGIAALLLGSVALQSFDPQVTHALWSQFAVALVVSTGLGAAFLFRTSFWALGIEALFAVPVALAASIMIAIIYHLCEGLNGCRSAEDMLVLSEVLRTEIPAQTTGLRDDPVIRNAALPLILQSLTLLGLLYTLRTIGVIALRRRVRRG